jgi:thiazole synthase
MKNDSLKIGSLELNSRLFLGTSQYPDLSTLEQCIKESKSELVTVGVRRIDVHSDNRYSLLGILETNNTKILPNTAGCYTAKEAILTSQLAREALKTNRIKLEVIGDDYTLYPDGIELLKAAEELVKDGFEVYPYCNDDVILCQKLVDVGCVCVMPLASPIGSGRGLQNPYNLSMIRKKIDLPVIVDAGIGTASDACKAMELGADAVLINTAVAKAGYPIQMAIAMRDAINAGRVAYNAKRIAIKDYAENSTPEIGKVKYHMK